MVYVCMHVRMYVGVSEGFPFLPALTTTHTPPSHPHHNHNPPHPLTAFHEVAARGHVRRDRVVKVIKMWYHMSLICGSDVSWVSEELGVFWLYLWYNFGIFIIYIWYIIII